MTATVKTSKTIVSTLTGTAPQTKAERRAQALADWLAAEDRVKPLNDTKNALKDAALDLCDDGKTYKDVNGKSYGINKMTEATDYSGTLKWVLAATNPLDLDAKTLKTLRAKLDGTCKPKKSSAPIKRID